MTLPTTRALSLSSASFCNSAGRASARKQPLTAPALDHGNFRRIDIYTIWIGPNFSHGSVLRAEDRHQG
jgi:hypothetical protein